MVIDGEAGWVGEGLSDIAEGEMEVATCVDADFEGGDGGWKGYVEDPQSMVFFTCQSTGKSYVGGATVSKVRSLRSNDNGVFVVLDECGTASARR